MTEPAMGHADGKDGQLRAVIDDGNQVTPQNAVAAVVGADIDGKEGAVADEVEYHEKEQGGQGDEQLLTDQPADPAAKGFLFRRFQPFGCFLHISLHLLQWLP